MSTAYITYQCSVCRRTKDILRDNQRVIPNHCTITKGCSGQLFKIGETKTPIVTPAQAGLTDWYPRGSNPATSVFAASTDTIGLATSSSGVLTLGLSLTDIEAATHRQVLVRFEQRRIEDTTTVQFLFRVLTPTSTITGRDSSGRTLRFDQQAIDNGRVFVRVNGVPRLQGSGTDEMVLLPNAISFNTALNAGDKVDVVVYAQPTTITQWLTFTANYFEVVDLATAGSWSNIRWAKTYRPDGSFEPKKMWVYTCTSLGNISAAASLRLDGIYSDINTPLMVGAQLSDAQFLLAASPYQSVDRYLNFSISGLALSNDFNVSMSKSPTSMFYVDTSLLSEHYPPLQLISATPLSSSSFVTADSFSTTTLIPKDTALTRLSGTKVIGPL